MTTEAPTLIRSGFMAWWKELDAQLEAARLPGADFGEAREVYWSTLEVPSPIVGACMVAWNRVGPAEVEPLPAPLG